MGRPVAFEGNIGSDPAGVPLFLRATDGPGKHRQTLGAKERHWWVVKAAAIVADEAAAKGAD